MDYDPYQVAETLSRMSLDLVSDNSSITSTEVSATLLSASRIIEELADTANHYRMRGRVMIVANGEEIELDEATVDMLLSESVKTMVTEAIEMYITAARVLPTMGGTQNA